MRNSFDNTWHACLQPRSRRCWPAQRHGTPAGPPPGAVPSSWTVWRGDRRPRTGSGRRIPGEGRVGYGEQRRSVRRRAAAAARTRARTSSPRPARRWWPLRDGAVVETGDDGGRGNYIAIFSPAARQTYVYLHMQQPARRGRASACAPARRVGAVGCTRLLLGRPPPLRGAPRSRHTGQAARPAAAAAALGARLTAAQRYRSPVELGGHLRAAGGGRRCSRLAGAPAAAPPRRSRTTRRPARLSQYRARPPTPRRLSATEPPRHPFMAPNGRSNLHNDGYQTDSYWIAGPLGRDMQVLSNASSPTAPR